jgi:hypothetical protein
MTGRGRAIVAIGVNIAIDLETGRGYDITQIAGIGRILDDTGRRFAAALRMRRVVGHDHRAGVGESARIFRGTRLPVSRSSIGLSP